MRCGIRVGESSVRGPCRDEGCRRSDGVGPRAIDTGCGSGGDGDSEIRGSNVSVTPVRGLLGPASFAARAGPIGVAVGNEGRRMLNTPKALVLSGRADEVACSTEEGPPVSCAMANALRDPKTLSGPRRLTAASYLHSSYWRAQDPQLGLTPSHRALRLRLHIIHGFT